MKATKILFIVLVAISALVLIVKACKETDLKERIKKNEKELKILDSTRNARNAVPIPFKSNDTRQIFLDSANVKNGFNLSVRHSKRN